MEIEIKTLGGIHLDELLSVFNASFSDYFVPLQLNLEQLKGKLISDKTNLDYSVGAFADNRLVGFILHGYDTIGSKKLLYNGGTGVIPNYKKRGLTKKMYAYILPILKSENINTLVLEVITGNIQAIKSYEQVGYKVTRKLICYKGSTDVIGDTKIKIMEQTEYAWESLRKFWDFQPSWQNSTNVLDGLKHINQSHCVMIDNQVAAYIVYNPLSKRIQQFAVKPEYRRQKIASTLFAYLCKHYDRNLTIINVDESSKTTNEFLTRIGFKNYIEQMEMKLELQ